MADVVKFEIIKDAAALDALSKKLSSSIVAQDKEIQTYLLSEIVHIEQHRNTTRLNLFFTRIKGTGARVNAMFAFVEVFGNVKFHNAPEKNEKDKDPSNHFLEYFSVKNVRKAYRYYDERKWNHVKDMDAIVLAASAKPWWKFRPERDPSAYVMDDKITTFFKGALKSLAAPTKDDKFNADLLADMMAVAVKHGIDLSKAVPDDFGKVQVPAPVAKLIRPANTNEEPKVETPKVTRPRANRGNTAPATLPH